jgi:hypothetical protein
MDEMWMMTPERRSASWAEMLDQTDSRNKFVLNVCCQSSSVKQVRRRWR